MTDTNNTTQYLPFEDEIASLDERIKSLKSESTSGSIDQSGEIRNLQTAQTALLQKTYSNLTPWQTVQVSRHPQRPLFPDYLTQMVKEPSELHGDRCFGDDPAIMTVLGQIGRQKVLIVGQNKGRDTKEKIKCNFGCPNPEGYRKAMAKMKMAEKFGLPIVTFIDTPGAYPGVGAEERGQAQAIAVNLMEMSRLKTPIISIVIGEGGSGGALGIGVGDRLAMLQYAYYSVISPEGCAGILWHDGAEAEKAAKALRLTSKELKGLGLIDSVIKEPLGGAHRSIHDTIYNVEQYIIKTLRELKNVSIDDLMERRYQKICAVGDSETMIARLKTKTDVTGKATIPERVSAKAQLEKASQQTETETAK